MVIVTFRSCASARLHNPLPVCDFQNSGNRFPLGQKELSSRFSIRVGETLLYPGARQSNKSIGMTCANRQPIFLTSAKPVVHVLFFRH
jgi:hypothetical protein